MAKWFLKNHDFIHVNSSVAGKYNKHKQDGSHLGFPIRMILATVDLQVTLILPMYFESIALSVQGKSSKQNLFFASSPEPKGQLTLNLVGSIGVTCRSKIAKIVPIVNPSWPPW